MNPAFHLYQLQKVDSQIFSLDNRLREISDLLKNDLELQLANQALLEKSESLNSANLKLKEIEQKILSKRNKLEQSESSLYAGNIKNPKELQDMQKEVASLKTVISDYENEQMEQMFMIEMIEKELKTCETQLRTKRTAFDARQNLLSEESNKIINNKSKLTKFLCLVMV